MKIAIAPRYQPHLTLAERVQVLDARGWRPATVDELAAICGDDADVSVIGLPRHLLKRWWIVAESAALDHDFQAYGRELAQFFQYKNWSVPTANVVFVVTAAGSESDEKLVPSNSTPFPNGVGMLSACINLDDENAAIVLGATPANIRIILEPGEGLILPPAGVCWTRSALPGADFAVTMLIGSLPTD